MIQIKKLFPFFFKQSKPLYIYESVFIKQLKSFAKEQGYYYFYKTSIYHRSNAITPDFILFIPTIGLIIIEEKDWNYKELKKATLSYTTTNHAQNEEILHTHSYKQFIAEKFNDITNKEICPIYHFTLLETLLQKEFLSLNQTFQTLLPKENIIFQDTTIKAFLNILESKKIKNKEYNVDTILPFIYSQYVVLENDKVYFATIEQIKILKHKNTQQTILQAPQKSGKTSFILQKSFLYNLANKSVAIITPTQKKKEHIQSSLLKMVELSAITLDLSTIVVYTPLELINLHRALLHLEKKEELTIQEELLEKHHHIADILFCDDALCLEEEFINYLSKQQTNKTLYCINPRNHTPTLYLHHSFHPKIEYIYGNDSKVLQLLYKMIKEKKENIFIYYLSINPHYLQEDITNFCNKTPLLITEETKNLEEIEIALLPYNCHIDYNPNYAIFLEIDSLTSLEWIVFQNIAKRGNYAITKDQKNIK